MGAFLPSEAYNISSALKCYTTNNLKYISQKQLTLGDYVVINRDINAINVKDILDIEVLETYIDNELVYKKKSTIL